MWKCQRCKEFFLILLICIFFCLYYFIFGYRLRGYWFDLSPLYIYPIGFLSMLNCFIILWFGTVEYFLRLLIGIFYFAICITGILYIFLYKYLNLVIKIKSESIKNLQKEKFIIFYFMILYDVKNHAKNKNFKKVFKILLFQFKLK